MTKWRVVELPTTRGDVVRTVAPPVARIDKAALESVVYLYGSVEGAKAGERYGGTGFLAHLGPPTWPYGGRPSAVHVVTNSHVIERGNLVVRVNLRGGGVDAFAVPPDSWIHGPGVDDIALAVIEWKPQWDARTVWVRDMPQRDFEHALAIMPVGVGDDAVMVGRFSAHDGGRERNEPVARFGNISKMAIGEPVRDGRGLQVEAFLVEMRTLAGFSGSPVYVHIPPKIRRSEVEFSLDGPARPGQYVKPEPSQLWLLGIDTGHKTWKDDIYERHDDGRVERRRDIYTQTTSGMAIVAPVWKIAELMGRDDVREANKQITDDQQRQHDGEDAVSDVAEDDDHDDPKRVSLAPLNPKDALRAMLRTPPVKDDDR